MDALDVLHNRGAFSRLLQACSTFEALADAKRIHAHMVTSGLDHDMYLGNHLVRSYDKCGCVEDARNVFDKMQLRNLISWNTMISAYAGHGDGEEALRLFQGMYSEGIKPNAVTVISTLLACASVDYSEEGKLVHMYIVDNGITSNVVGNALVSMYAKCGGLQDALSVFQKMPCRDEVSWNAMLSAYAQQGKAEEALQLYRQMNWEGAEPGKVTYMTILNACAGPTDLGEGRIIHEHIIRSGIESDVVLGTALLNMYRKCGNVGDARRTFDKLLQRNLVSWNVMVTTYAQHGDGKEALDIFKMMEIEHVKPDNITFSGVLSTCDGPGALADGKMIHDTVIKCGIKLDVLVGSSLVSMYGKCGSLHDAQTTFDRMPEDNLVSWNAMIAGHAQHEHTEAAIEMFQHMQQKDVKPDKITFICVLSACCQPSALEKGKHFHALVLETTFSSNVAVGNALVTMYGKCGTTKCAQKAFEKMPLRDMISWNALMAAYAQQGHVKETLETCFRMEREGVRPNKVSFITMVEACNCPAALTEGMKIHHWIVDLGFELDEVVGTALASMYGRCGKPEAARSVFDKLDKRDVVSWSAMIALYGQHGHGMEAFQLFQLMINEGVLPNKVTYVSIIDACANVAALPEGKLVHSSFLDREIELDVVVGNALISMYGKCGSLENAESVFVNMPERDVVSWSAMIAATAQHGHGKEAVLIFCEMGKEGVKPDSITFVSVLAACSHAGLVDEGCRYFDCMKRDHGIEPTAEHYLCMVDLLGRTGRLHEAEDYIKKMPFKPSVVAWMTLLSACRIHDNLERAQCAAEQVLELDPQNEAVYVVLSNIYSAAGRWEEAAKMRRVMAERGVKKLSGQSLIVADNEVHKFVVGDMSHPQTEKICAELDKLGRQMKAAGYVPDTHE